MSRRRIYFGVKGGSDFDALIGRGVFDKRRDATTEAKKYPCSEVWRYIDGKDGKRISKHIVYLPLPRKRPVKPPAE